MQNYKFNDGTILTQQQVMQRYDLDDDDDLAIWADDHYDTVASQKANEHIYSL